MLDFFIRGSGQVDDITAPETLATGLSSANSQVPNRVTRPRHSAALFVSEAELGLHLRVPGTDLL